MLQNSKNVHEFDSCSWISKNAHEFEKIFMNFKKCSELKKCPQFWEMFLDFKKSLRISNKIPDFKNCSWIRKIVQKLFTPWAVVVGVIEGTDNLIKNATESYKSLFDPAPGNVFPISPDLWYDSEKNINFWNENLTGQSLLMRFKMHRFLWRKIEPLVLIIYPLSFINIVGRWWRLI